LIKEIQTGKSYDESKYLKALKEKGSPLLVVEKAC
jgi:hypothetical protein